jgi:hypothetical protein
MSTSASEECYICAISKDCARIVGRWRVEVGALDWEVDVWMGIRFFRRGGGAGTLMTAMDGVEKWSDSAHRCRGEEEGIEEGSQGPRKCGTSW